MDKSYQKFLLLKVANIAIKAGTRILDFYYKNNEIKFKKDNSPLTQADLAANNIIIKNLENIDKNIPLLSEESLVSWPERKNWNLYWLIDPLDGTKEFINKNDEFTVNIALIKNNRPILGVIYSPVLSHLYFAFKGYGAYRIESSSELSSLDKASKISISFKNKKDHLKIISSRSHSNDKFFEWVKKNIKNYEILKKGSSLKFCAVAEGKADLYPRLGPTSEWDIAAGHLILLEAGGSLFSIEKKEILYNAKENILNSYFIASGLKDK